METISDLKPEIITLEQLKAIPPEKLQGLKAVEDSSRDVCGVYWNCADATDYSDIEDMLEYSDVSIWKEKVIALPSFGEILERIYEYLLDNDQVIEDYETELNGEDELREAYQKFVDAQTQTIFSECLYELKKIGHTCTYKEQS